MARPPIIAALAAVASSFLPSAGGAQDLSGSWRSTRDDVDVTVREWGPGCGPRPSSRHASVGREAAVRATATSLSIDTGGRTLRSDRCWSDNRDVAVRSASHPSPTRWVSTCSTPDGAALGEHATYTVSAEGDRRLTLRDETEYEWNIQGSVCRARSVALREYERVGAAPAPAPGPAPAPAPAPAPTPAPVRPGPEPSARRCARVGAASVLVIAPSRRSLPVGGRTCFRARVLDAARCEVDGAAVAWALRPSAGAAEATVDRGCVSSTRGEGAVEVVATAGTLSARAVATIVSEDQYRSLAAAHIEEEDASVEAIDPGAGQSLGVSVRTESPPAHPGWIWPAVALLGGATALGLAAWLLSRRRRKPAAVEDTEPTTLRRPVPAMAPPYEPPGRHRREAAPVEVFPKGADATSEAQTVAQVPPVVVSARPGARRCPVCGREFLDASVFCTEDGAALVAAEEAVTAPTVAAPKVRVCPKCQRRYEPLMDFCVDDGERLKDG